MPVEHAVIAYQGTVLVEDKATPMRLQPVIQKLIGNATRHDSKASYQYDGSLYSLAVEHEILYMVVTDAGAASTSNTQTMMAYTFISDMQSKFKSAMTGNPHSYPQPVDLTPIRCVTFGPTMQSLVKTYTDNPNHNNKMVKLKTDIDVVKTQMLDNIDAIVQRGGDIERVCDKTEMLAEEATTFNRRSGQLRRKMWMKNVKLAIAIGLALLVLGFVISMVICGFDYSKCKHHATPAPGTGTWVPGYYTLSPGQTISPGYYTLSPGSTLSPGATASPVETGTPAPGTPVPPIVTASPGTPQPPAAPGTPQPPAAPVTPQPPAAPVTPEPPAPATAVPAPTTTAAPGTPTPPTTTAAPPAA